MQLTKYCTVGKNIPEQLSNASIISKQLKLIVENEAHETNVYGEPISYMKNILFNATLVLYKGLVHIKHKNSSLYTHPFLNTIEFKVCLGLTNRKKLKTIK